MRKIFKSREPVVKHKFDYARRAVSLLGDDHFGHDWSLS